MIRRLTVILLAVGLCLMGITPVLAQKLYPTLAEYEETTGNRIESFNEAPVLKTMVASGELLPVEQRLPEEPMVVEPLEEIGQYGGTLRGPALAPTTNGHDLIAARAQFLFTLSLVPNLQVVPNIARGWDLSEDMKTLTVYLRRGMKWSDGVSFNADDFLFWYEDIILNDELTPAKPWAWSPGGELAKVEKLNDYTVRFRFATAYPSVIPMLALDLKPFAPKHYLKKWHPKYNPEANEIAKKEGYEEWWQAFAFHYTPDSQERQDTNRPSADTWVLKKIDSSGNKYFERNPYYFKIDTAGNQLPYIDTQARILIENKEIEVLKVVAGELDYAGNNLTLENYPLFKKGEEKGGYHTLLFDKLWGSELFFSFELNHKDPVLREIFNDIRFRQAMSLAINREDISQTLYFGKAVPRQATVPPETSFYEDWMGKYYTEYAPERANELLDEMGLGKGKDGYRLRPDGEILAMTIEYCPAEGPRAKICQLVGEYWEKVGVKVEVKEIARTLYLTRGKAVERDMGIWQFGGVAELNLQAARLKRFRPPFSAPVNPASSIEWWNWYTSNGETGEEPPEEIKRLFRLCDEWLTTVIGTEEYMRLGKEILTINVENLYCIGTVGQAPWPIIIKNNLKNTPEKGAFGWSYRIWKPYQPDQWFFKN